MSQDQRFADAQTRVRALSKRPSNADLLELYALYKQGTAGDVSGKRPGMLKITERAKYDAWAGKRGLAPEKAREQYVELVDRLVAADR